MSHVNSHGAPFVVTAKGPKGLLQRTLMTASSAILLAQILMDDGYTDVEVTDPKGNLIAPGNYQREGAGDRS